MSYADPLAVLIEVVVYGDGDAVDAAYAALPPLDAARAKRTTISNRQRRDTFERDHYQCRYCGSKLILSEVLALLAVIDAQRYPWHRNWRVGGDSSGLSILDRNRRPPEAGGARRWQRP